MKKRLEINMFFLIFLFIAIMAIFTDFIDYFLSLNYYLELILSSFLMIGISVVFRKKIKIKNDCEKSDIIFFGILFFIAAITITFPDKMYDTINYHLFNQISPFEDKINYNFFPSTLLQSYSYAYADRIFYIFRFILGYRLGLLLNYLIIIILYYQIKNILKNTFKINDIAYVIISILSVFTLSIIDMLDTYYIDLMSLVVIFELLIIVLYKEQISDKKEDNNLLICYIALLSGISFAIKITNIFFVILLAIIFFIKNLKNIKNIKLKNIIMFILIFFIPSVLYIFETYKQTGNPVFPFYNKIFKSEYFPLINWMDTRFGPNGTLEILLWPVYAVIHPERSIDVQIVEPILAIGYVISIIYIIYSGILKIRKKITDRNKLHLSIIIVLFNIVWSKFLLGYIRYGLIIILLNGIITFIVLYEFLKRKKYIYATGIVIVLLVNYSYTFTTYKTTSGSSTYNNYLSNGIDSFKYNLKNILGHNNTHIKFDSDSVWLSLDAYSGYETMLNDEIPIIFINYDIYFDSMIDRVNGNQRIENDKYKNLVNIYEKNIENKKMYIVVDSTGLDKTIEHLNNKGYYLENLYGVYKPNFVNYFDFLYVFEVTKNTQNNNKEVSGKIQKNIENDVENIEFLIGIDASMQNIIINNYRIEVLLDDEIIYSNSIKTNQLNLEKVKYKTNKNAKKLIIHVLNEKNEEVEWVNMLLLNYVEV